MNTAYIIDAKRTAVGKAYRGALKNTLPDDMLGALIQDYKVNYSFIDWSQLDDVIIGCAMPEAEQGMNIARIGALMGGLPDSVPAVTINRFCASGIESIAMAANAIQSGRSKLVFAGGVESMSMVPMGGNKFTANPKWFEHHIGIAYGMGITAEIVAEKYDISREAQDTFSFQSHQKALHAIREGFFKNEIMPMQLEKRSYEMKNNRALISNILFQEDEGPRQDTAIASLNKLKPVFSVNGTVTAGNSSQMSDGAGLVLLANEDMVKAFDLKPIGRFVDYAVKGVQPELMGIGPVESIPYTLKRAGLQLDEIDIIELNEAFAAQALAVINTLKLPDEKINRQGGAIALGHPLGATGAIRTATLMAMLKREKMRYGMVTMCIGTGMGATGLFECF